MSFVDDLIGKLKDVERRVRYLERLDVNPPVSSAVRYSGTPTAGRYASWSGAGTVVDSGFGTSDLPRYSGTPTAGRFAYWTGAGTVADSTIGTSAVGLLGTANAWTAVNTYSDAVIFSTGVTGERAMVDVVTIGDITSTQVLTVDVTISASNIMVDTEFAILLQRAANANVWGYVRGWASWQGAGGGATTVRSYDITYGGNGGTVTATVTAITGGIRITISSTGFTNTLTANMAWLRTAGINADTAVTTVTIT